MVAPSFQSMTIMSDVFIKNEKEYIKVKNPKTGTIREVRWYSDKEYKRAYGSKSESKGAIKLTPEQKKMFKPAAVRSIEVSGTNPRIIKATAACNPLIGFALVWQAYGALIQEKKGV